MAESAKTPELLYENSQRVKNAIHLDANIVSKVNHDNGRSNSPNIRLCTNVYICTKNLFFLHAISYHLASRLIRRVLVLLVNSTILDIESELLFLCSQLSLELLVRVPDGLDLEEALDLLQRNTTGLGNEEEGKEEGEEGEGGKEEVDSVAHSREHLFGEPRYEEVEQPVTGSGAGLSQRAEVRVEEFLS